MTDAFIETFLAGFDDSQYPDCFLQKYEMMECLSSNETGETFLVQERGSGDYCIAKCYSKDDPPLPIPENTFLRKVHHKNLPAFIGEYENEEMLCIVRSYAQGEPLDNFVSGRPLKKNQVISIAKQICEILIYLHQQDPPIIHRDIKPQNIIINEQGEVSLIDFGISRVYNAEAQTDTTYLGTRHFAAPEQYGFSQTDCRTDIFSLGVLLAWMLTGKTELEEAKKVLPHDRLRKIILKCTAFDPKDRYHSAIQVRDALSGKTLKRRLSFSLAACALILFGVFHFPKSTLLQTQQPTGVSFQEPLIEEAARLILQKEATEQISEEELLSIETLLIFGDKVALDDESLNDYVNSFTNNDGTIQRGSISQLGDLVYFQNLRRVSLAYQSIEDISPLSQLEYLESVDFRNSPIEDISPLSGMTSLGTLIIFDTNVTDLTSLQNCTNLTLLDIGYTPITSLAALDGLDALEVLVIRKGSLQSLDQIETHPMLEEIYLSENSILDFSPLLDLPQLQLVEVSEDMRSAIEAITDQATFSIIYQ